MSDQSPPPPKPKPGSLRDRIAAFEKSASTTPSPAPPPAVRPKPAGFSSWKPKAPSPPSSPPAATASTEHATSSVVKPGGMSASDAKESITKGGSLKDRMAALQGKGAFGAPPPVAPKPALEKPKWKPPPVVQAPVDDDDHDGGGSAAAIAAAVERTISPPVSVKSPESVDAPKAVEEEGEPAIPAAGAEGGNEGETAAPDPEEEERQRRAAIAARMARLGGARLGMAPPVFGKKPPVRRPTQEDAPKVEEPKAAEEPAQPDTSMPEAVKSSEEQLSPPAEPNTVTSPPTEAPGQVQAESDVGKSPEYFPTRKNSESASILSSESVDSHPSRSPSSMPVPVVPRRAGPPRKKPVKPAAPPPEVLEEVADESVPAPVVSEEAEPTSIPEAEPAAPTQPVVASPEHEEVKPKITEETVQPPVPEPSPVADHETHPEPVPEPETGVVHKEETESVPIPSHVKAPSLKEETPDIGSPPTPAGLAYDEDTGSDYEGEESEALSPSRSPPATILPSPPLNASHPNVANFEPGVIEPTSTPVAGVLQDESEATEEEARKKRVADRIAKMGGINPFAPPPQAKPSPETPRSPPAPATFVPSPPVAPVPVRKQSLQLEPLSPPPEDAQPEPKGNFVESTAEEEDFDEDEDYVDEVNGEPTPASTSEADKPVTPALPHSESHRQSANFASRPPPIPPLGTRPPVQVQQYEEEDDDGSDYGDDNPAEDIPVAAPLRPPHPSGHPSTLSAIPTEHANKPPSPPARPAQPPRRIIPQAPEPIEDEDEEGEEEEETDEEADERLATSQLFVPPPSGRGPIAIPRHVQAEAEEDGDGSENDSPALPVLQRRSLEIPPGRAVPPPPPVHAPALDEDSEPESDHDGEALPIPPRHTGGPPPRLVPLPPPPQVQAQSATVVSPPPPPQSVRRTLPPAPRLDSNQPMTSPEHLTPTVSISESDEILDEEEGDPIDPSFHSPSRRGSAVNLFSTAQAQAQAEALSQPEIVQAPPPPVSWSRQASSEQADETEQDPEQLKRRTIAERMAKLGGIRFGGAPMPIPASRPVPPPRADDEQEEERGGEPAAEEPAALSEEEEERARKERISAKLAGMGGMRIGMMPMGMGSLPPQRSHVLREENVGRSPPAPAQAPPARAVPPPRPPPPPAPVQAPQGPDSDSDYGSAEDGVKVEAEESEMEEVGYEEAKEPIEEAPPVPSRGGRAPSRRESAMSPPMPPIPSPRPPVPSAIPTRRSSVQTSRSTGSTSGSTTDYGMSPPQRKTSSYMPQSEYVMVEEPEGQEAPPPPPARPVSRVPPMRSTPQIPQPADTQDSISSQWELPSIPTPNIDFGGGADLSLSWTDAGEPTSPTSPPPPPPPSKKPSLPPAAERQLSSDDLIGLWGRVGVQVCESATTLFEKSKRTLIGDGTYEGFVQSVLAAVPNAASVPTESGGYGYVIYVQNGPSVQKRVSEIMPGDVVEILDGKLKGHKGIQTYHQNVGGSGEALVGIVGEFEVKKSKIRVFQANQHVGQQTVESVSYRLEDLKSGIIKVYRVLDA